MISFKFWLIYLQKFWIDYILIKIYVINPNKRLKFVFISCSFGFLKTKICKRRKNYDRNC